MKGVLSVAKHLWEEKRSERRSVVSDSLQLHTVRESLQARILEWVYFPSPGNLPNTGIEPRSPTLQADSLPPGRPIIGKSQPLKGCVHLFCLFFSQVGRIRPHLYEPSKGILPCIQAEGQYPLRQVIMYDDDNNSKGKQADEAATTYSPNWCFSATVVGHGLHRAAWGLSCPVACVILEIRPILREILNHCTIREAPRVHFLRSDLLYTVLLEGHHVQ